MNRSSRYTLLLCAALFIIGRTSVYAQCPGIRPAFKWWSEGAALHFQDRTDYHGLPVQSQHWYFDGGYGGSGADIVHTYAITGVDSVALDIQVEGCQFHVSALVAHGDTNDVCGMSINSDFTSTHPQNNVLDFTDQSSTATFHLWVFGDDSASFATSISHAFVFPGAYTVAHSIETSDSSGTGCEAGSAKRLFVDGNASTCDTSLFIDFSFTQQGASVHLNGTMVPFNNSLTIDSISWDIGDHGSVITSQLTPSYNYVFPGEYQVCFKVNAYDTVAQHSCFALVCKTLESPQESNGISEVVVQHGSIAWPVPFEDVLHIRCDEQGRTANIMVYDMAGRLRLNEDVFREGDIAIDCRALDPGEYIVRVVTKDRVYVSKVIKVLK